MVYGRITKTRNGFSQPSNRGITCRHELSESYKRHFSDWPPQRRIADLQFSATSPPYCIHRNSQQHPRLYVAVRWFWLSASHPSTRHRGFDPAFTRDTRGGGISQSSQKKQYSSCAQVHKLLRLNSSSSCSKSISRNGQPHQRRPR